eukprot:NODE_2714_length_651_cov_200.416944_g2241_i0.p2 GENE.NODE_2714_length_651_cov_200.416944_g2241_i0~~NODE_2714_length_651_cov_200.416944_g2241_i0.p2  ORF type:complete len:99 (+),score=26.66 NODE_2714_length_651_cov_200.416944_g2241_i0:80-376(+)
MSWFPSIQELISRKTNDKAADWSAKCQDLLGVKYWHLTKKETDGLLPGIIYPLKDGLTPTKLQVPYKPAKLRNMKLQPPKIKKMKIVKIDNLKINECW